MTILAKKYLEAAYEDARHLLEANEGDLPEGVKATLRFCVANRLWYLLSRNPPVTSCRDAASRRRRLGYVGIPLSDELRSYLAELVDKSGRKTYVLFHCRGNQSFDFEKLGDFDWLQGQSIAKTNVSEILDSKIGYGLINPFTPSEFIRKDCEVVQFFDHTTISETGETSTMMTNAGERTWGIEFSPRELVQNVGKEVVKLANIASTVEIKSSAPRIGILTGNAPDSGMLLWKKINAVWKSRRGDLYKGDISNPNILINSAPMMGWTMELEERSEFIKERVIDEVRAFQRANIEKVLIACNTTQFFSPEIRETLAGTETEFFSIPDTVRNWIEKNQDKQIFAAGIGHVTNDGPWSAYNFIHKYPNIIVPNVYQSNKLIELAYDVKKGGVTPRTYQKLRSLIRTSECTVILLLLTELSMIFDMYSRKKFNDTIIVDAMDLYAEFALETSFDT